MAADGFDVPDSDFKYIVFKRAETLHVSNGFFTFRQQDEVEDAIVIRRQDYFASPALATYAAMIAIAIKLSVDPEISASLQRIADYFERQSRLAADEGWKFPDV